MKTMPLRLSIFAALFTLVTATAEAGKSDGRFDVYWIDVEGGAATLMVTPVGEAVLVDSGNPGTRDADRIVQAATRVAGLTQIDHLITTHYHGDHFGGASTLATFMPIKHVHDNGEFEGGRERPDKSYLEFKAERRSVISPGDEVVLKKVDNQAAPISIKCLATRQTTIAGDTHEQNDCCSAAKEKPFDKSDNANSVVMLVSVGPFRFFDGGDLTWNIEKKLVCPVNLVGKVDVYQVGHHGLDASNNPVLVKSLEPTVAIMNNGVTKGCGPETFATLKETSSVKAIYQSHKNLRDDGTSNTPDEYIANLEKECKANYIKLSVDPVGKSYTVSIPANGHEKTYQTRGPAN